MIIDFHTHILPPFVIRDRDIYVSKDLTLKALYSDPKAPMAQANELIDAMDAARVDRAVVMGFGWTDPGLAREVNDYLLESADRYSGRLVPFCSVNPTWGDIALQEVERCARLGAKGVGELHPDIQGFDLADVKVIKPLVEVMRRHAMIMLTHTSEPVGHIYDGKGATGPSAVMGIVEQFPDIPIVCAHWGGGLPFYALMPEVAAVLSNTYLDTAASPLLYHQSVFSVVPQLMRRDAILLGSDYPLLRLERLIRQVEKSSLTEEDKQAILGGNAQKLLGLDGYSL